MTAPALYRHFPGGKSDIVSSVLDLLDAVTSEGLRHAVNDPGSALTKRHRCFDVHIGVIERYRAVPNLFMSDLIWIDEPHLKARMLKNRRHQQAQVSAIIREGQDAGEIRHGIEVDQIFVQFLGQFLTIAILYSRRGDMIDPKTQADANWKMFIRSVAP